MSASEFVASLTELRLNAADMMRAFDLKPTRFYHLLAIGRFDAFEIKPRIGKRFWCAKKVQAYFDGNGVRQASSFKKSA